MSGASLQVSMASMCEELKGANPLYRPSAFWEFFASKNCEQLDRCGLQNFKRTVNQNYYNWLPTTFADNQLQRLLDDWRQEPSLEPLRVRLNDASFLETIVESNPLGDPDKRDIYALFVGLLWHHAARSDRLNLITRLSEPAVGHPIPVMLGDKLISQDLANSIRECNAIVSALAWRPTDSQPLRMAELGAGYGRLAYVFAAGLPCSYWIFDIPPALAIAQAYLTEVFPQKKSFHFRHFDDYAAVRDEAESADICFLTPNQLERIPDLHFDAFASISSLAEMTAAQIENYKRQIGRTTRETVYIKQWSRQFNSYDQLWVDKSMYRWGGGWRSAFDRTDDVHDQFFELAYRRRGSAEIEPPLPYPARTATPPRGAIRRLRSRLRSALRRLRGHRLLRGRAGLRAR